MDVFSKKTNADVTWPRRIKRKNKFRKYDRLKRITNLIYFTVSKCRLSEKYLILWKTMKKENIK